MNKKYILILLSLSFLFSDNNETTFKYSDNKWYIGSSYSPARYISYPIIIGNAQNGFEFSLGIYFSKEIEDDSGQSYLYWDNYTSEWIEGYNWNDITIIDNDDTAYNIDFGLSKYFESFQRENSKGSYFFNIGCDYYKSSYLKIYYYDNIDNVNHNINETERINYAISLGYLVEYFFKNNFSITLRTGVGLGYSTSENHSQHIDYYNGYISDISYDFYLDEDVFISTNSLDVGFKYYFNTKK